MTALVLYRSKYGAAREAAERIASCLGEGASTVDLRRNRRPDLGTADLIVLGGSIYAGKIQVDLVAFCQHNREALLSRPVGLYVTCLFEGDRAREELNTNFPPWLTAHAFAAIPLGGRLRLSELGFLDRLVTRRVAKQTEDVDTLSQARMDELCEAAKTALKG